jgi:arabinogalactan endo-1,4-beta-galactosidase
MFGDTKGVIRIRISKKNRQHNDQKKKYKGTNNDLQNAQLCKLQKRAHSTRSRK